MSRADIPGRARRSIDIPGFAHGDNPIPAASRVGPLLMTGGIHGIDRTSGRMPDTVDAQVANMFANLEAILEAGGATLGDVVRMTVYLRSSEGRAAVNAAWCACFPEPAARPARRTRVTQELHKSMLVQCDATAFILGDDAPRAPP